MEILTSILEGALVHKDSLGNGAVIRPGELQRMTAGTGIRHSEVNPSATAPVRLLQIWIIPMRARMSPGYEQTSFPAEEYRGRLRLIADPEARDGAVAIHKDASLYVATLEPGRRLAHEIGRGRGPWLQVTRGIAALNGTEMREGDGAAIEAESVLDIEAESETEVLLFDLG
jgi:redox-sensitive bicupin YhaK (pirin superfamily)